MDAGGQLSRDIREEAAEEADAKQSPANDHTVPPVRVPTAEETAESVRRAQRRLHELKSRQAIDARHAEMRPETMSHTGTLSSSARKCGKTPGRAAQDGSTALNHSRRSRVERTPHTDNASGRKKVRRVSVRLHLERRLRRAAPCPSHGVGRAGRSRLPVGPSNTAQHRRSSSTDSGPCIPGGRPTAPEVVACRGASRSGRQGSPWGMSRCQRSPRARGTLDKSIPYDRTAFDVYCAAERRPDPPTWACATCRRPCAQGKSRRGSAI
jgi:hypothetical protein